METNISLYPVLIKKRIKRFFNQQKVKNKSKIFCIGKNKTGTTSLKVAFRNLGYVVGEQDVAEHIFAEHYEEQNFEPLIEYCKSAEVFQDVPFSFYPTLEHIDRAYPGSKYILTVRDNADQWYRSFVKYYSKKAGVTRRAATFEELNTHFYSSVGYREKFLVIAQGVSPEDPFEKEHLVNLYHKHNDYVREYFKDRPNDLLEINIAKPGDYQKFLTFIGEQSEETEFPWENKT